MQHKMKFDHFALINVTFSLNENFKKKKKKETINPEILLDYSLMQKNKELAVLLGVRQISGNIPYYFEVRGAGIFEFDSIPDKQLLKQLATINCPAILFPYLRETIADLTRRAGFPPLHVDPINFIELAKQREEENQPKKKRRALSK